ncbi:MAG: DUF2461 domain-containing protein [Tannerella sp.]|jgi:uncharacterized protein (TIGR02453 family)|nr:DUF2461 domain-containing protein [Tannerella sp.]
MIKKETLSFLETLQKNNNREWFQANKSRYREAYRDMEDLISELIFSTAQFDEKLGLPDPKKCIFRIYRDVRFSTDKSPYKTNFGAIIGLKKNGYYLHIGPGEYFLACGYYLLLPEQLKKLRKGIYDHFDELNRIISNPVFRSELGDLQRDEDKLQRVPNDFDKDHPAAEYMKLKRFYVMKPFTEDQLFRDDFVAYTSDIFRLMMPLKYFLSDLLE